MNSELLQGLLHVDKSVLDTVGFNPYYLHLAGLNGGRPKIGQARYFDLASNDYLGLASDARVQEAMVKAIREYGTSMCGTPIATGYVGLLEQLERELAAFVGVEAALILPSCYQANLALFPTIASREDLVLVDHYAHASLAQGIKASGCRIQPFLHNDMAHLQRLLSKSAGHRRRFVVTESVFSTEGSVAPVAHLSRLCLEYEAIPVIDDSHGLGVLGKGGSGILRQSQVLPFPGVYTASLGKALAQTGGVIGGPRAFIEALRYTCPGLIYSTALTPASAAGVLAVLQILRQGADQILQNLIRHHQALLSRLDACGFRVSRGDAPIAAISCDSAERTLALAKHFYERQILTTPFVPPSVPPGQGILRLIIGAKLAETDLPDLLERIQPFEGYSAKKPKHHAPAMPHVQSIHPAIQAPCPAQPQT